MNHLYFCLLVLIFTTNTHASTSGKKIIYGEDNRKDTFEITSSLYLKLAKGTAAQILREDIIIDGMSVMLKGKPLSETIPPGLSLPICHKERFSSQPTAANCSGFLVEEDVLITAGHCLQTNYDCENFDWVFNYKVDHNQQENVKVNLSDIYHCERIIRSEVIDGLDYALVKLDRPKMGSALKISTQDPTVGTKLVMIGHPSGLPQKITDEAKISELTSGGFMADLDAFRGNSGSGVFNAETGEILGILVNGKQDYIENSSLKCSEVNVVSSEEAGENVSSFRQFLSYLDN